MKTTLARKKGSRRLNPISSADTKTTTFDAENSDGSDYKTLRQLMQERDLKALAILQKMLSKHFSGKEYGFFFIPKQNAFRRTSELLNHYSANMAMRFEPPTPKNEDDDDEMWDFSGRLEFMFMRAQAKIAKKLMLSLQGSVRVVTLKKQTIHSFPITFGSFSLLMKWLHEPRAFEPGRMRKYKLKVAKSKMIKGNHADPVFFKMRGTVPMASMTQNSQPRQ